MQGGHDSFIVREGLNVVSDSVPWFQPPMSVPALLNHTMAIDSVGVISMSTSYLCHVPVANYDTVRYFKESNLGACSFNADHVELNTGPVECLSIHEIVCVRATDESVMLASINATQDDRHTASGYYPDGVPFPQTLGANAEITMLCSKGSLKHSMRVLDIEERGSMCQTCDKCRVSNGSHAGTFELSLSREHTVFASPDGECCRLLKRQCVPPQNPVAKRLHKIIGGWITRWVTASVCHQGAPHNFFTTLSAMRSSLNRFQYMDEVNLVHRIALRMNRPPIDILESRLGNERRRIPNFGYTCMIRTCVSALRLNTQDVAILVRSVYIHVHSEEVC